MVLHKLFTQKLNEVYRTMTTKKTSNFIIGGKLFFAINNNFHSISNPVGVPARVVFNVD